MRLNIFTLKIMVIMIKIDLEEMILKIARIVILGFSFLMIINANAQNSFVLSGIVKDATSGEVLPGVSIFEESTKKGTSANEKGFYTIKLKKGDHKLTFSFMGYEKIVKTVNIAKESKLNIELSPSAIQLDNIVVSAEKPDENVTSTEVSIEKLDIKQIESIPIVMGETDIFKTIQMLPGINSVAEGRAGFIVRGADWTKT